MDADTSNTARHVYASVYCLSIYKTVSPNSTECLITNDKGCGSTFLAAISLKLRHTSVKEHDMFVFCVIKFYFKLNKLV